MRRFVVIGNGSMAKEAHWAVRACAAIQGSLESNLEIKTYDANQMTNPDFTKLEEVKEYVENNPNTDLVWGTWRNRRKVLIYNELEKYKLTHKLLTINFSNYDWGTVDVGPGCFLYFNSFLGPNVKLGKSVTVNYGSYIAHDSEIGDFTNISTGVIINGTVKVGKRCNIGSGVILLNNIEIGDDVVINFGCIVNENIPSANKVYTTYSKHKERSYLRLQEE